MVNHQGPYEAGIMKCGQIGLKGRWKIRRIKWVKMGCRRVIQLHFRPQWRQCLGHERVMNMQSALRIPLTCHWTYRMATPYFSFPSFSLSLYLSHCIFYLLLFRQCHRQSRSSVYTRSCKLDLSLLFPQLTLFFSFNPLFSPLRHCRQSAPMLIDQYAETALAIPGIRASSVSSSSTSSIPPPHSPSPIKFSPPFALLCLSLIYSGAEGNGQTGQPFCTPKWRPWVFLFFPFFLLCVCAKSVLCT